MRCYFVKDARIVAFKELPGLSCEEAAATARTMFEESASTSDGVEVWSLTRRIYRLGRIARKPLAKSSDPPRSIAVSESAASRSWAFWRKAGWCGFAWNCIAKRASLLLT